MTVKNNGAVLAGSHHTNGYARPTATRLQTLVSFPSTLDVERPLAKTFGVRRFLRASLNRSTSQLPIPPFSFLFSEFQLW